VKSPACLLTGLLLPEEEREEFVKKYKTKLFEALFTCHLCLTNAREGARATVQPPSRATA
jgi:hypothetical protein